MTLSDRFRPLFTGGLREDIEPQGQDAVQQTKERRLPKRISAAVLQPLKEALASAYWYKRDLRAFLATSLDDRALVAGLDWGDGSYKWNIVHQLVDTLAQNQARYFDQLLNLLLATADIRDPSWLKRLDDGPDRYRTAVEALDALRVHVEPLRRQRSEQEEAERRRREEETRAAARRAIEEKLAAMRGIMSEITGQNPQRRGYSLEKLLNQLFLIFDIDARGPFRVVGEQIDGAFTLDGEYLLEAKWQDSKTPLADLDTFSRKVERRLDNTLGLFVSINEYEPTAVDMLSQRRAVLILMDGSDLYCVLEGRIALPDLLRRKRQHAGHTGQVFVSAYTLLQQ